MAAGGDHAQLPLVTVAVPVYNGAAFLDRALRSIVGQSHANIEIVVSDNASTDATADIIRQYAGRFRRFRCFRQPATLPVFDNFRFLFDQAQGEFFFWAPHDDYWDPRYIETGVTLLSAEPAASMVMGTVRYFNEHGKEILRYDPPYRLSHRSARDRVSTYLQEGTTDHLFYAMYRTAVLRDVIWSRSTMPEKAIIMHALLKGPVLDGHGMEYYNRYVAKSREEVARIHALPEYNYAYQARAGLDVATEITRWAGGLDAVRLLWLYFFSQSWHKFLIKWLLATLGVKWRGRA
jgi:glycosyltransferase involved in cell wall biosynthesis